MGDGFVVLYGNSTKNINVNVFMYIMQYAIRFGRFAKSSNLKIHRQKCALNQKNDHCKIRAEKKCHEIFLFTFLHCCKDKVDQEQSIVKSNPLKTKAYEHFFLVHCTNAIRPEVP